MFADTVLYLAWNEVNLQISWRYNKARVQEYIRVSVGTGWSADEPTRSWCGDFAFWVLTRSGVSPLPSISQVETERNAQGKITSSGWNTVSRFGKTYPKQSPKDYTAKPGDMFYMPKVRHPKKGLIETHHFGFVVEDPGKASNSFKTINGNGKGNPALMVADRLGGGYVSYDPQSERGLVEYFVQLPE